MTTVAVEGQRFGFRKTVFRKSWARGGAAEGGDFRTDSENAWGAQGPSTSRRARGLTNAVRQSCRCTALDQHPKTLVIFLRVALR